MNAPTALSSPEKSARLVRLLTLAALVLMVASYFAPTWWVSLTAPNYPPDAFPDGIRIHFQFTGVHNGCSTAPKSSRLMTETLQEDLGEGTQRYNPIEAEKIKGKSTFNQKAVALDCVHEMNTINHYVGMHPIGIGAPVERQVSRFIIAFFAVCLVGFMATTRRQRLMVLAVGFAAVAAWMVGDLFVLGSLDEFTAQYMKEAGAFFREPERIQQWGRVLQAVTTGVVVGLIGAMVAVWLGVWKIPKFSLVLALAPALLPVFFVIDYAGWLWFFGHNLHPWGAFTLKPFMPTVFGEGKVAQFSTYSYPYWGYGLLLMVMVCLLLALLLRRKAMAQGLAE